MPIAIYPSQNLTTNQHKWLAHYKKLIEHSNSRVLDGYSERHHIIPRCLGGGDEKENIAILSAREHYIAHQLLAKIYPEVPGLIYACHMMCVPLSFETGRSKNREYEWIRKLYSEYISKRITGRTKETHPYLIAAGQKVSKALKGRSKETHPYIEEVASLFRTRNKNNHPGVASQSAKIRGRSKETHTGVASQAAKLTGRTKFTHPEINEASEKKYKLPREIREHYLVHYESGKSIEEMLPELEKFTGITKSYLWNLFRRMISERKKAEAAS